MTSRVDHRDNVDIDEVFFDAFDSKVCVRRVTRAAADVILFIIVARQRRLSLVLRVATT